MSAQSDRAIEAHPAQRRQQVLPIVSLHLGSSSTAEQYQLQRTGISDVRCDVEQVFTSPPCADGRTKRVALSEEGYRERQRQGKLEQASAKNGHESAEWHKQYVAGLVEHQVRKVKDGLHRGEAHRRADELPGPDDQAYEQRCADDPGQAPKWIADRR